MVRELQYILIFCIAKPHLRSITQITPNLITIEIGKSIHYGTQVTHLLLFGCKIGVFKIAGCVCLQKKVCLPSLLQGIFWWFLKLCIEN